MTAIALSLFACDDAGQGKAPKSGGPSALSASASGSAAAAAAPTAASGKTRCDELNKELWLTINESPKSCFKKEDCVIVGPGKCKIKDKWMSCVAGISKGNEEAIDVLSKRWETAGCDKGLAETQNERLVCRAGTCQVIHDTE